MGRAKLMEQQQKRRDALKATKKAAAAKATRAASDIKKYGSGGKPAVTRDASKDKPKKDYSSGSKPAVTRDTSKDTKKSSKPSTSSSKPSKPASAPNAVAKPSQAASSRFYSSTSTSPIAKKLNKEKAQANFFAGGAGGEYDKSGTKHRGGARAQVKRKPSTPKPKRNLSPADRRREQARRRRRGM